MSTETEFDIIEIRRNNLELNNEIEQMKIHSRNVIPILLRTSSLGKQSLEGYAPKYFPSYVWMSLFNRFLS